MENLLSPVFLLRHEDAPIVCRLSLSASPTLYKARRKRLIIIEAQNDKKPYFKEAIIVRYKNLYATQSTDLVHCSNRREITLTRKKIKEAGRFLWILRLAGRLQNIYQIFSSKCTSIKAFLYDIVCLHGDAIKNIFVF